jgi:hypothetical protein
MLEVFSAFELFHHDHIVLTHLRGHFQELVLLLGLSEIDNISPALLILGLEIFEELVKALISLGKFLDRLIQAFTWVFFVALNKILKLFDLSD